MYYTIMDTCVGEILIAGDKQGLRYVSFCQGKHPQEIQNDWEENQTFLQEAVDQLEEYFAGKRRKFSLKLSPEGNVFQLKVLKALEKIPYGVTKSYGEIAEQIGHPKASRAVGMANGRNPISIIIPCHRVIGKSGKLVGFGGGLDVKRKLLLLEGADIKEEQAYEKTLSTAGR
ncbi:MAG: methylated-DNA--[protein]-cysteine S-methyltransferase [Candidatus Omnitrophica bacterium]|nr:methylated-DNA--[protein]-cysteine S-methyltransferase [Candidatus Omnitrophota bacterium]MCB9747457.1 methylated-DNA--[protein]-cysteine S-methyltransferase [Candidatus Omnitrophota bacterium]